MIALSAEGTEFDDALKLEGLTGLAANLSEELSRVVELLQTVGPWAGEVDRRSEAQVQQARERVAVALRRRAARTFQGSRTRKGDPLDALAIDSRRLRELEMALVELSPAQKGLRQELLVSAGRRRMRAT